MTLHPKAPVDLLLAPVAAEIDRNLQALRDEPIAKIDYDLALALDDDRFDSRAQRREAVLRIACREVNLHGWEVSLSDDDSRIHLSGGSVTLDVGLGMGLTNFIEFGPDHEGSATVPHGAAA